MTAAFQYITTWVLVRAIVLKPQLHEPPHESKNININPRRSHQQTQLHLLKGKNQLPTPTADKYQLHVPSLQTRLVSGSQSRGSPYHGFPLPRFPLPRFPLPHLTRLPRLPCLEVLSSAASFTPNADPTSTAENTERQITQAFIDWSR